MEYFENDCCGNAENSGSIQGLYHPDVSENKRPKISLFWLQGAAALLLCILLLSMKLWYKPGADKVKEWLVASKRGGTEMAVEHMVMDFVHGTSFPDAVAAFCQELIDAQN